MPDANASVRLAQLPSLAPDHFRALVRFPPGWQRLRPGHYSVDEDFLVLEGDLHINALQWRAQEHGFVPAHALRERTFSRRGCLACARFHGRPRWHAGASGSAPMGELKHSRAWPELPLSDMHGLGLAHRVFAHAGLGHWVVPAQALPALRASGWRFDELDLQGASWVSLSSPS